MADVFVSYSRRDGEFVGRLCATLDARGKQVWLDTEGIVDAEVFPEAIRTAIESSDAFLFVISPDAVSSDFCEQEVSYASTLGKRIVPVLRHPVPDPEIPVEIRERNWIPFVDDAEFDAAMDRVVLALDTDLEHRKEHTRWLVKAIEWDREERDQSFLLRGSELTAAESWLARTAPDDDPAPAPVQQEYVLASRQASSRRQRRLVGASLAVAVVAIGLLVFALISRGQAVTAKSTASSQALAAKSQSDLAVDPETSILLAVRALGVSHTPEARLALRQALDTSPFLRELPGAPGTSCRGQVGASIAYRPNGTQVAEGLCSGGVLLVDPSSGRVSRRIEVAGGASALAYTPDGQRLAVADGHGVELYDPGSGSITQTLSTRHFESTTLAISPDGATLAVPVIPVTPAHVGGPPPGPPPGAPPGGPPPGGPPHGVVILYNLTTGTSRDLTVPSSSPLVGSMAFTPDSRYLIVGSSDQSVPVYDLSSGALVHQLPLSGGPYGCSPATIGMSATGTLALGANPCDGGGTITMWSTQTWTEEYTLTDLGNIGDSSLAFTPDGQRLAVGEYNGRGSVWSLATRTEIVPIVGITTPITEVSLSPDGKDLATASNDGIPRLWRATGPELLDINTQSPFVESVGLGPRSLTVTALRGNDIVVETRGLPDGRVTGSFVIEHSPLDGALVSPDGRLVVGLDPVGNGEATIFDVATQHLVRHTSALVGAVTAGWSPDDRRVVLGSAQPGAAPVVIDVATGNQTSLTGTIPNCYSQDAPAAAFSGGNRLVAWSTFCGQVIVWDTATGREVATFDDKAEVSSLAFDPRSSRLAVASWNGALTVWDVHTRRSVQNLVADVQSVERVIYSPDGRWIVTTSQDGTARVWDARTAQLLRIDAHPDAVLMVTFGPGQRTIATVDIDGVVRIWDACTACEDPNGLVSLASRRVLVHPTPLQRSAMTGNG